MRKELLFSVTRKDCRIDYFRGSGKGGQHRNKKDTAVRITHIASGAVGKAEDQRSREQNQKLAWRRLAESKKFRDWVRIHAAEVTGELEERRKEIDKELKSSKFTKVEVRDNNGKWVDEDSIKDR